jgi:hypothetical protein
MRGEDVAGKMNLNGCEVTVREIMRHEMPALRQGKWDQLYNDMLLRLEQLSTRNALRYEMPGPTDATNARIAVNKRLKAAERDDVELVAVRQNGHSVLFVAKT